MLRGAEDAPIQSDAYIDALLNAHARKPVALPVALGWPSLNVPAPNIRQVIRLLERGLPRFHPSFLFEESLADQLRAAHGDAAAAAVAIDRRLLMGSAIASGFSIASAAAVLAWRRRRN